VALALLAATGDSEAQVTFNVQYDQEPLNPLTGHPSYFQSIGAALALASPGDTILVHEDWYSEDWSATSGGTTPPDGSNPLLTVYNEDVVFPAFDITIKADPIYPGQGKVIKINGTGAGSVVTFDSPNNTRSSVLDGFTITAGVGSIDPWLSDPNVAVGGGIKCLAATPTIQNCTVKRNRALLGAGIYASVGAANGGAAGSSATGPLILNCRIDSNRAQGVPLGSFVPQGGGLMSINCSPEIDSTEILWNTSSSMGGGISFWNEDLTGNPSQPVVQPIIRDSNIHDNTASTRGGGIYTFQRVNPLITRCLISFNEAGGQSMAIGEGGGLFWANSQVELDTCHIFSNRADLAGGGLMYEAEGDLGIDGGSATPGSSLIHCTIESNLTTDNSQTQGGGIRGRQGSDPVSATTRFENCLVIANIADNGGGAYLTSTRASFQNCTISQNLARGTAVNEYAGGVYFNNQNDTSFSVILQDSILDANRSNSATPPSAWQVDFDEVSQFPTTTFNFCMMATAVGHLQFTAPTSNLTTAPLFATGVSSTYFPNAAYYLSVVPFQAGTSPAYNVGSQVVGPQLAVDGMTCRSTALVPDTGLVDLGFHYPLLPTLP